MIPSGYKASKVYSVLPTDGAADLTFSRAGALPSFNATRVNSDGLIEEVLSNVPRLDYSDGGCPSLLIEPESTNLILRSEEFDNAAWAKTRTTVLANSLVSPDGNLTADKLVEDSTTNRHFVSRGGVPIGQSILSVFAKQGERKNIGIGNSSEAAYAVFDLSNGTLVSVSGLGGVLSNAKIQSIGNGWYRISVENNKVSASGFGIITANDLGQVSYSGDGTSGLYIWGAQLEALPYATSYIPTVASTVTRVAETVSKTGISSLIGQTEGTVVLNFKNRLLTSYLNEYIFQLKSTAGTNQLFIRKESGGNVYTVRLIISGITIWTFSSVPIPDGDVKLAVAYKTGDSVVFLNGVQIGSTNTSAFASSSFNDLFFSNSGSNIPELNLQETILHKTRLSNEQLIALTQ
jgi:hypothetical protein